MDKLMGNVSGVGFLQLLALLFIGLKLSGVISWSWWWVLLPLYGGVLVFAVLAIIAAIFFGGFKVSRSKRSKLKF